MARRPVARACGWRKRPTPSGSLLASEEAPLVLLDRQSEHILANLPDPVRRGGRRVITSLLAQLRSWYARDLWKPPCVGCFAPILVITGLTG
jgi:hypothetical protein